MSPSREPVTAAAAARPRVRRSIATVSLSGPLEEKLAAAAQAGFDGVEIFELDLVTCHLPSAEIQRRACDLGLEIMLYQPFRDFEAVPDEVMRQNLGRAERKFELMTALGADLMLVCSNVSAAAIDDDARAAGQLRQLAQRAGEHGIGIAFEALAWGRHINGFERAWRVVSAAGHPQLGLCLDSFHILSLGHATAAIRRIPAHKIFFVQLADAPLLSMDPLAWSRHYRCFPGQGGFGLTGFMADVLAAGYHGPWSLEVFNDVFRQANAERTAVDGMRSLLTLEDSLAQAIPTVSDAAAGPVALTALPPPAELTGYAFAELAVDGLIEPAAEAMLHGLGFARTARHRSKPVRLWQQADIRILVNGAGGGQPGQPRGDAAVAAIAVESRDPAQSARRAAALLAPAIPRSYGPGEADLTAVAAPDGTAVFFCRTGTPGAGGWLGDFQPATAAPAAGPRPLLTAIDHIALSQPFDYFDEAMLFYQSLLGLRPEQAEEVASPYGLVRSRSLRNREEGVRLVLNVPLLGGGPADAPANQHVAFACGDIFAAAAAVRSAGVPVLPVPANYYDDLAARFGLDDGLAGQLRRMGVLYDRDSRGGEFFHFYTVMLGRRLFFEIVQRTGGYQGFGAPSTPVRMAAQLHQSASGGLGLG
jgi:3-dehydroshikimate dehydratase